MTKSSTSRGSRLRVSRLLATLLACALLMGPSSCRRSDSDDTPPPSAAASSTPAPAYALGPTGALLEAPEESNAPPWMSSALIVRDTVMVPMRDGTRLATEISHFVGARLPTILVRSPYGLAPLANFAEPYNRMGLAIVVQSTRGRPPSEGESLLFLDDGWGLDPEGARWDGYDTIEWIVRQPWSNGKVGVHGGSALGMTAYFAAASSHPALVCAVVEQAPWDIYKHGLRQGGVLRLSDVAPFLAAMGASPRIRDTLRAHPAYDDFWQRSSPAGRAAQTNTAILHVAGWFDPYCQAAIDAYVTLQEKGGRGARGNQRLIVGPWAHGAHGTRQQGELLLPGRATMDGQLWRRELDWVRTWLLDEGPGRDMPNVTYYVMGDPASPWATGNIWRQEDRWPPPSTEARLFLRPDGGFGDTLDAVGAGERAYEYDPGAPTPGIGGANLVIARGPHDQRRIENGRDDLLFYRSELLADPITVIGNVRVLLYAETTATDIDWMARLIDVYPDGRAMLVTEGALKGRLHRGLDKPEPLEPGRIYPFDIDLGATAIAFDRGHRLQVTISSANVPRFAPGTNTGAEADDAISPVVARNIIHHGPLHPSALILPVVEATYGR